MKVLTISLIAAGLFFQGTGISMHGIKINDPESALKKVHLKVVSKEDIPAIKYRTPNGNDLSITVENGKVVYMENDWLHESGGTTPLFSGFKFGKTSLREIRQAFGTNGFTYVKRNDLSTDTEDFEFNCFELDSPNKEILVLITAVSLKEKLTEDNIKDKLKLVSIVLADQKYLDDIWGDEKAYDSNYKKVKL